MACFLTTMLQRLILSECTTGQTTASIVRIIDTVNDIHNGKGNASNVNFTMNLVLADFLKGLLKDSAASGKNLQVAERVTFRFGPASFNVPAKDVMEAGDARLEVTKYLSEASGSFASELKKAAARIASPGVKTGLLKFAACFEVLQDQIAA